MILRRIALFFAAAALLVAAQGALEHRLVYGGSALHAATHGADGDNEPSGPHHCDLCVAFSAVAGIAGGTALPLVDLGTAPHIGVGATGELLPRAPPAFRGRAPPILS
jgi:hypothetical protein